MIFYFLCLNLSTEGQTFFKDYVDGVIYLNLKEGVELRSDISKWNVDYKNHELFKNHEYYQVSEVVQPFYYIDNGLETLKTIFRIKFNCFEKIDEFIEELELSGLVDYAEKNPIIQFHGMPNDQFYFLQRDMLAIAAHDVWDHIEGDTSIVVAVVDDGFDINHEDFENVFIHPYNATNNTSDVGLAVTNSSHGTFMAGLIGANRNNEIGIAGLASGVRIMPIKFEDFTGAYEGIFRAAYQGANIINCSWGGEEINYTARKITNIINDNYDCIILTSAGNNGSETVRFPSTLSGVITIAGTSILNWDELSDVRYPSSNYGDHIDYCTPTGGSHSTVPYNEYFPSLGNTSSACALASAMFALVWSVDPDGPPSKVIQSIMATTKKLDWTGSGNGSIELLKAIEHMEQNQMNLSSETVVPININPNPTREFFRLNYLNDITPNKVLIYQRTGNLIAEHTELEDNWFNINGYPSGIYFVKCIYSNGESHTIKFMKR